MKTSTSQEILKNGLWHNNQALVALLGLCPLLAVSNTLINGLGLGLATTLVITASNGTISAIRQWITPEVRLPVFVLIIASFVTAVELLMNAYLHELHKILGIFIPLIVTNCAIVGRAEAFASKNTVRDSLMDGLGMGLGFTGVLITLGAARELVGQGTILADIHLMFGEQAHFLTYSPGPGYQGMLLAILPPGAFIGLGLLIALKNVIDKRATLKTEHARQAQPETAKVSS